MKEWKTNRELGDVAPEDQPWMYPTPPAEPEPEPGEPRAIQGDLFAGTLVWTLAFLLFLVGVAG